MSVLHRLAAAITALILSCTVSYAQAEPQTYYEDGAGILYDSTKNYINLSGSQLMIDASLAFYVVTAHGLDGRTIEEASRACYQSLPENSVLLFLAQAESRIAVQAAPELRRKLGRSKVERLLARYAEPHLEKREWNDAIFALYPELARAVCPGFGTALSGDRYSGSPAGSLSDLRARAVIRLLALAGIGTAVILIVRIRRRRGRGLYMGPVPDAPDGLHGVRPNPKDAGRPNYVGIPPGGLGRHSGTIGSGTGSFSSTDPRDIYRPRDR